MKSKLFIYSISGITLFGLHSCNENDLFRDITIIGHQGPQVYWELPSLSAGAGDSVLFRAQYYGFDKKIKELQVWYDTREKIEMQASCPLVTTFSYNLAINMSDLVRQDMLIATYPHQDQNWNPDLSAFVLNEKFPTSRTLRTIEWKEVKDFDQKKFDQLFPDTFMTSFRSNLYLRLKVPDLRKILVSTEKMTAEEFRGYTEYEIDENSNDTIWKLLPGIEPFMKTKYDEVTFPELIYNSTNQVYAIEYSKSYDLSAKFKAVDENGISGISEFKVVELR
ncbi:MAG: hypothetical protein RR346_09570 [Bacteroidales bacterium]